MAHYQEAWVKLTNAQLNKLKFAAKYKRRRILRITKKNFQDEELLHQLFVTTIQKTRLKNAIAKNMSMDIKLSQAQLPKLIQSGRFLPNMFGNSGKKVISPWHSFR